MPAYTTIITPENITIRYSLAGISSRAIAFLIDTFYQFGCLIVCHILLIPFLIFTKSSSFGEAIYIAILFFVFWGYHIFFEVLRNGQTPGKKSMGIRVVMLNGQPLDFFQSSARNILRTIDFMPFLFFTGVISIFLSKKLQRIGDLFSGTIIIIDNSYTMNRLD